MVSSTEPEHTQPEQAQPEQKRSGHIQPEHNRSGRRQHWRWILRASVAVIAATITAGAVLVVGLGNGSDSDFDPSDVVLVEPVRYSQNASSATRTADNQNFRVTPAAQPGTGQADGQANTAQANTAQANTARAKTAQADTAPPKYAFTPHPNPVPAAVPLNGGRTWVPWPQFDGALYQQMSGIRPFWEESLNLGDEYFKAVAQLWSAAMPPYTPAAASRIASGESLSISPNAGKPDANKPNANKQDGTFARVVDTAGLDIKLHLSDDRRSGWEQVRLCPPHPGSPAARNPATYQLRDGDPTQIRRTQELAQRLPTPDARAGEYTQLVAGMRSPTGLAVPSWGATDSDYARLLSYSPGEPTELASSGHSLADNGFFPGDWSKQARELLVQQVAVAAVADTNVWHAVQTRGPESLWEACQDLAALAIGDNTDSDRLATLETLWSRGIRLSFTSPPIRQAYVAELSPTGRAQVLVCHPADIVYLVDAATGERLEEFKRRPARVEAQWLRWVIDRYRVAKRASFTGACETADPQGAFAKALAWGRESAVRADAELAAGLWAAGLWTAGLGQTWLPIHEWVKVSDAQAWRSQRDLSWAKQLACESGIARGEVVAGVFEQRDSSSCTTAQLRAFATAAAAAPERTTEFSGTVWQSTDNWFQRMYLSPFRTTEEVLGCSAAAGTSVGAVPSGTGPTNQRRLKKPWPPGLMLRYSQPHFPCPAAKVPPETDRYWWPQPPTAQIGSAAIGYQAASEQASSEQASSERATSEQAAAGTSINGSFK